MHIICHFSDMQKEIPMGFEGLKSRLSEIKNRTDYTKIIGFYPQSSDLPDENKCHYYHGVEVENQDIVVPDQLLSITIPTGHYVSIDYKGALQSFNSAYNKVNSFINEHGLKNDVSRHVLEVKNINNDLYDKLKEDNEITLMIPVNCIGGEV